MTEAKRPIPDWLTRVRTVWNDRAPDWDKMSEVNALTEDRTADIARLTVGLDLHHGSSLLDAGCGTGQWAIAFATLGCAVTAQDLAPAMVDRARDHAKDRGVSITFRTGDISALPDPAATYDAIFGRCVLLFVPDPLAVLREFRRVLKPGGGSSSAFRARSLPSTTGRGADSSSRAMSARISWCRGSWRRCSPRTAGTCSSNGATSGRT